MARIVKYATPICIFS